jgi:ribosomal protein S18 acetylase RimI-like enzyme
VIVPAQDRDLDPIARITFEREGGTYDQARQRAAHWFADAAADAQHNLLLVARAGRTVAGYARAGFVAGKKSDEYDVPEGWYLGGIVVAKAHRRRGIGSSLTRKRLEWIAQRGGREAYYFVNSQNRASIDLHVPFGFAEVRRDFCFPGVTFSGGGTGILFRAIVPRAKE